MFGFSILSLLTPTAQPAAVNHVPPYVEVPPEERPQPSATCSICESTYDGCGHNAQPVNSGRCCDDCAGLHVFPARLRQVPRRASGPRMENGRNKAVMRALAAGCRHLHNGESLKAAAQSCNACVPYTKAVVSLRRTGQTALLDAALNGDVPLLVAAYQTATATNLVIAHTD
jgi:hypothetical protein